MDDPKDEQSDRVANMFCRICYTKLGEPKLCPACYNRIHESLFREEEKVLTASRR